MAKNCLQEPQKITDESDDYRKELNTVSEFLVNNLVPTSGNIVPLVKLFKDYLDRCRNNMKVPETKQAFNKKVERYFEVTMMAERHKNKKMLGYIRDKLA